MLIDQLTGLQRTQSGPLVLVPLNLFNDVLAALGNADDVRKSRQGMAEEFAKSHCSRKQRVILRALANADGKPVKEFGMKEDSTYVHVYRLREKLIDMNAPMRIETVRGFGYRLAWVEQKQ